jgi:broad specificity phosphatase PhoE
MADTEQTYGSITRRAMVDTEVTWLHLFRHGQAATGGVRLCRGHLDIGLSPQGHADSLVAAEFAATLPPVSGVLSSDLVRTRTLADHIGRRLGLPVEEHPGLREQFMGSWEGRPWEELNAADAPGVAAYWDDYAHARPGGGETYAEVGERVVAWWRDAQPRLAGGRWIVVTHTGVIRAFCCALLGLDFDQGLRFAPGYASHTQLGWAEAGGVMVTLGELPPGVNGTRQ